MNKSVYRKSSLEQMSTPDKLDMLITITRPPHWIALLSIFLLMVAVFIWSVTATIPVRITGAGVFTTPGGVVEVTVGHDGQLTDLAVEPGQYVERGQTVARMYNPAWTEKDQADGPATSAEKLVEQTGVVSMQRGMVVKVNRAVGEWLKSGDPVMTLQTGDPNQRMEVVAYLPLQEVSAVKIGMEVRVWPNDDTSGENGALIGEVVQVASIPASSDRMLRMAGNPEVVAQIAKQGPQAEVRVRVETDVSHPTGLRWTSPKAASDFVLQSGQMCTADFLVQKIRPIEWLF